MLEFIESISDTADSLFRDIDQDLQARTLLVLVDVHGDSSRVQDRIAIVASTRYNKLGYAPADFSHILDLTFDVPSITERPKSTDLFSGWLAKRHQYLQEIAAAVESTLNKVQRRKTFLAVPVAIGGNVAIVILQVLRQPFERYQIRSGHRYKGQSLFLESLVKEYLIECFNVLAGFALDPSRALQIDTSDFELLRRAGQNAMAIAERGEASVQSLFEVVDAISAQRYERKASHGRILFAHNRESLEPFQKVTLRPTVSIRENPRAVRKLLELCDVRRCLWHHQGQIEGLVEPVLEPKKGLFSVEFLGHHIWELRYRDQPVMRVMDGRPGLPRPRLQEHKFRRVIENVFADDLPDIDVLWKIVTIAVNQDHGTTIIISSGAPTESNRLGTQSTRIVPGRIPPEVVPSVTSIDGGLLLDPRGTCYAIGTLLDGLVSEGDTSPPPYSSARGSRYNSSVRYVKTSTAPCVVVVVSDDGMAELIHLPTSKLAKRPSVGQASAAD